jgi:hypothetical protein
MSQPAATAVRTRWAIEVSDPIAITQLVLRDQEGRQRPVAISVSTPIMYENEATCDVSLAGLYSEPFTIYGQDTFRALCLAIGFVRKMLVIEEEKGVTITLPNDACPFDWRESWFSVESAH